MSSVRRGDVSSSEGPPLCCQESRRKLERIAGTQTGERDGIELRLPTNSARQGSAARVGDAVADEPGESAVLLGFAASRHWFKTRDRATAIDDQNRRTFLDTGDEGAQTVLSFADAGLLH
jgi:hypothetical protein